MKKNKLKDSRTLIEVRKIKEAISREAEKDRKCYQNMNGMGKRLLASLRKKDIMD